MVKDSKKENDLVYKWNMAFLHMHSIDAKTMHFSKSLCWCHRVYEKNESSSESDKEPTASQSMAQWFCLWQKEVR